MLNPKGVTVQLPGQIGQVGVVGAEEADDGPDLRAHVDPYVYQQLRKQLLLELGKEIRKECLVQARQEMEDELNARRAELQAEFTDRQQAVVRACQAVEKAAVELAELRDEVQAEAQAKLPALIVELTHRVLGRAIEAGDYDIDEIIRSALKELPPRGQIVVRMNPDDYDRSELAGKGAEHRAASVVQFTRDHNISRGGCIVESNEGQVDATIEESLAEIDRTIRDTEEQA